MDPVALEAARVQAGVIEAVAAGALERGIPIDAEHDRNRTGLIGEAHTKLTSTLGSLPAKRTAAAPDAAALLVRMFRQAGVREGSMVAVNASGSFPGFALAAVSACGALGAKAVVVLSIGASSWGANRPEYTVFDMFTAAGDRRAFPADYPAEVAAVSPGGADDRGPDLDRDAVEKVLARAEALGIPVIRPASLGDAVAARMALYRARGEPDMLLTIGGNYANSGADPGLSNLSGAILPSRAGDVKGTGLIQEFLRAGKPVVQILDVAGLSAMYGIPFDPHPVRPPGEAPVYRARRIPVLIAAGPPLLALGLYFLVTRRRRLKRGCRA
jgi:poly-gamma-glutamate system protein